MISALIHQLLRACLAVALALVACAAGLYVAGSYDGATLALTSGLVALACGFSSIPALRTLTFTAWIVAAVVTALLSPQVFQPFAPGTPHYKLLLLVVIQAVMFGMGTQMGIRDFVGIARTPLPVMIGLLCQFTIMPLVGFGIAIGFRLPPEIGAGMVLIGSCSSGLASNVMAYIAKANLALSITLTAVATLLAPIVTPFWMKTMAASLLEGTDVTISFVSMMASIVKIVIVPTGAALVHDYLLRADVRGKAIAWGAALAGVVFCSVYVGGGIVISRPSIALGVDLFAWVLGGIAFGVIYHIVVSAMPQIAKAMPALSMAGIIYVTGMTTAEGRDHLLAVGVVLIVAAGMHNFLGYLLGYGVSRLLGMNEQSARTVAIEVGMQNGGMATGIAADMGKLATLGLPAAIFIAWMNVSGSLLANYWRRRPPVVVESHQEVEA
ncbi:bile acid:sodium symporter family protein [Botrimarina mediterranea]|uniref:bile acid:sodium symporter family protein n=1 Tax=Botrimarina mediterranea TaxID=2528022 RepID=UPI00118D384F|nr:Sodium Bile acid symporter family protein [Planctomycetes bacterium K2D]